MLRELINTNRDGEKGYKDAAEHAKAADLQSFFRKQAAERTRFASQFEAELARLGESDDARRNPATSPPRYTAAGLT